MENFRHSLHRLAGTLQLRLLWLPMLCLLALALVSLPLTNRLNLLAYDFLAQSLLKPNKQSQAVVVAIDEASLAQFGPWPWSRQRHAELLQTLRKADSGPVAFAILFASTDPQAAGDEAFAAQIALSPVVILPVAPAQSSDGNGVFALRPPNSLLGKGIEGHVDVEVDPDGMARRLFLKAGLADQWWPALAWSALTHLPNSASGGLAGRAAPRQAARAGIWQRDGELMLRNDLVGEIPVFSYRDVLSGGVPDTALHGKTVFVGVTVSGANGALSMANYKDRPLFSAVEYHARVFEALRQGLLITPVSHVATFLLGLGLLLAAAFTSRRTTYHWSLLLLAFGLLPAAVSFLLIHSLGIWFPPIEATIALSILALCMLWRQMSDFEQADSLLRKRTRVAMESIADGLLVIDSEGRIEQVNNIGARLLGAPPGQSQRPPLRGSIGQFDNAAARNKRLSGTAQISCTCRTTGVAGRTAMHGACINRSGTDA